MTAIGLRMTSEQHARLKAHLHPGDGREAAAWLLCGRRAGEDRHVMCVREVFPIAHEASDRGHMHVTWRTESLAPVFEAGTGLESPAIVHAHSHPTGAEAFSITDDQADRALHADLAKVYDDGLPTASLVLLPDGRMLGRAFVQGHVVPLDRIMVVGPRLEFVSAVDADQRTFVASHRQAFGAGTSSALAGMRVAVIGCSGTGSVVVELLARLGVGELVLVDPQKVEDRNLNRIINASIEDVTREQWKVDALAAAVSHNLGHYAPRFTTLPVALKDAWAQVATADVVFGCTDGAEGRMHLDLMCQHYTLPYIDVGVDIVADGDGGVSYVGAAVHYVRPGGDSLLARGGYRMATVAAEEMRREHPERYAEQRRFGYIENIEEERPAVISLNTLAASMAVNELLARLHGFRAGPDEEHAARRINLVEEYALSMPIGPACPVMSRHLGRGDRQHPLGLPGWRQ